MKGATRRSPRKTRIRYTDESLELRPVADFLPPPEDLIRKEETVKVTLGLSRSSVKFFKGWARKRGVGYQTMIRRVLDLYVARNR